jgi:hypothetical protein
MGYDRTRHHLDACFQDQCAPLESRQAEQFLLDRAVTAQRRPLPPRTSKGYPRRRPARHCSRQHRRPYDASQRPHANFNGYKEPDRIKTTRQQQSEHSKDPATTPPQLTHPSPNKSAAAGSCGTPQESAAKHDVLLLNFSMCRLE